MDPMSMALMEEPLTPFTTQFEMGRSERKSLRSGEMWVVQPLSRRKGEIEVDASLEREEERYQLGQRSWYERSSQQRPLMAGPQIPRNRMTRE